MTKITDLEKMTEKEQAAYFEKLAATWSPETKKAIGIKPSASIVPKERIKAAVDAIQKLLAKDFPEVTLTHVKGYREANPLYRNPDNPKQEWRWSGDRTHKKPEWLVGNETKFRVKESERIKVNHV